MPSLSGQFNPRIGPIINIGLVAQDRLRRGTEIPANALGIPALIDTGATSTCISREIAERAGIQPIGMRPMSSATGSEPRNLYLVSLLLPFGTTGLVRPNLQVMEFTPFANSPFQALIGRDVICLGVLTMSFDGRFTFSL